MKFAHDFREIAGQMTSSGLLSQAVFIDSSAVLELEKEDAKYHMAAHTVWASGSDVIWVSLNATAQETYTRARTNLGFKPAIRLYDMLKVDPILYLAFTREDEAEARTILVKYKDQDLSFHDALLAAVMKRVGSYRVFSFDHHFYLFGFEVLPGPTV